MSGLIDAAEPISDVPVVEKSESSETQATQNKHKKKIRFKPIKKKQWKPFCRFTLFSNVEKNRQAKIHSDNISSKNMRKYGIENENGFTQAVDVTKAGHIANPSTDALLTPLLKGDLECKSTGEPNANTEVHSKRKNKKLKKEIVFKVETFNRFSILEEFIEDDCNHGQLEEKEKEIQEKKPQKSKNYVTGKSKTNNKYKKQIQTIYREKKSDYGSMKKKKKKCRQCGCKRKCKGTGHCPALDGVCSLCSKPGHYSRSLNCKKGERWSKIKGNLTTPVKLCVILWLQTKFIFITEKFCLKK